MTVRWLLLAAAVGITALTTSAADWPQWRGPNRDAVAVGFNAPATWPKQLTKKWTTPVGNGVATPALAGGKLYTFTWQNGKEIIRCLDADTGKELWKDQYAAQPASGPAKGFPAARSSPAVAGGKVVTLGVQGALSCLDAGTGKVIWRKDDTGRTPGFATSSSPVLLDGLCVVQVGGDRGGAVVAFDLDTGKEKWRRPTDGTKFASPTPLTLDGLRAVVVETAGTVSAVGLDDGKLLWETSFSSRYNASSPVVDGQTVLFGGSNTPTRAVKVEKQGDKLTAKDLWTNRDTTVIYNTPVVRDGLVFGISERGELFCLDESTGKVLWSERLGGGGGRGGGYGSVVSAGPVLFALTPAGQLVVFEPGREEFKEVARYRVADQGTYAYPVVAGNRVYIKDTDAVTLWTIE
jgi:outer membrane protein assembly factor BamB